MCGCIYGLVRPHTVAHGLVQSRRVSHGLSRPCTIANTIIHGHGTRVSFFKSTAFTDTLDWHECNSDKATVGTVVCTVYTDGQLYKPCVLCQTGFTEVCT